jgi:YfiH family protein
MALLTVTVPALGEIPGLVHGFERRAGPGETPAASRERVSAALSAAGRLLFLQQVHGSTVVRAPWDGTPPADAALASRPGLLLGIVTADCLPVVLVDPLRRAVAAAHAGWRGTAAGVVTRAVEALVAAGSRPQDLLTATGPGIGPCCYEVGEELQEAFGPAGDGFFHPGPRGRPHLDLRAANAHQLQAAGIAASRIHHVPDCTSCRADLYYSYRRDGPGTGRMITFVGFRAPSSRSG